MLMKLSRLLQWLWCILWIMLFMMTTFVVMNWLIINW